MNFKQILLMAVAVALTQGGSASAAIEVGQVIDGLLYQQTGPDTVTPLDGGANAQFIAETIDAGPTDFDGGILTFPGPGSPITLANQLYSQFYVSNSMTLSDLDAAFPSGLYTITATNSILGTSDSIDMNYLDDMNPTVAPALTPSSFISLQDLDSSAAITLTFNSFTPDPRADTSLTELNFIDLTTGALVTSPGNPFGHFNDGIIPANIFSPGNSYVYELGFLNEIDSSFFVAPVLIDASEAMTEGYFTVASVPEPETWAVILIGIAGMGASMRIRRRRAIIAS